MTSTLLAAPTLDHSTCAAGGPGGAGCRLCVERCPYGAIEVRDAPDGTEIRIEPQLCQRCGACSGVCPTTSIERSFLPDDELVGALLTAAGSAEGPVVAITCPDSAARTTAALGAAHVVVASSLLVVNETHLLAAVAGGARGVLLVGCPSCTHGEPQLLLSALSVTRALVREPHRVAYVEDDRSSRFEDAIVAAAALPVPEVALGPVEQLRLEVAGTRRDRLRVLVPLFGGGGATMPLAAPGYGAIELDQDACVACGACAVACPTDALRLDPTAAELSVTDIDCVGCGACVSACPDDALTLHPAIPAGAAALEPRVLLEDRAVACRRCGRLYAAERLLAHARSVLEAADVDPDDPRFQLGVCPSCRAVDARDRPLDQFPGHGQGCACGGDCGCGGDLAPAGVGSDRRRFLKGTLATIAAGAALPLFGRSRPAFGVEEAPVIRPGRLGMVIDLERCIGCHACTNVCKAENDVPLGGFRDWVEEHELASGTDDVRPYFLPKLCNHCDEPGCLKACPTGAIYRRPDGIIDLDPNICIACQACMHGCPYGMTFYNASRRTADKCNYCAHRIDEGLRPACVDICPSQCRIFGDLEDPDSPPSRYLATHETSVIREELGLGPNTYYVGLPGELNR